MLVNILLNFYSRKSQLEREEIHKVIYLSRAGHFLHIYRIFILWCHTDSYNKRMQTWNFWEKFLSKLERYYLCQGGCAFASVCPSVWLFVQDQDHAKSFLQFFETLYYYEKYELLLSEECFQFCSWSYSRRQMLAILEFCHVIFHMDRMQYVRHLASVDENK